MNSDAIITAYAAIPDKDLQAVLLAEYRCRDGCLLLHVWQSPIGPMYYRPGVPLSEFNGMARFGTPAQRKLPAHGGLVADFDTSGARSAWGDDDAPGIMFNGLVLGCGHCWGHYSAALIAADVDSATPGAPIERNDVWGKPIE